MPLPHRRATHLTLLLAGATLGACQPPPRLGPVPLGPSTHQGLMASVAEATARPGLVAHRRVVGGVEVLEAEVDQGHAHVLLGRRSAGGQVDTLCVSDAPSAERFLSSDEGRVER